MKAIKFEILLFYFIYMRKKSNALSLKIRFSVKTAPFSAIFVLNFSTPCTLQHLSALDIQYKMFTPVYTGVHPLKLNQAHPQCTVAFSFISLPLHENESESRKMTQNVGRLLRKVSLVFNRLQLMSGKSDHLQRTAVNSRDHVVSVAEVIAVRSESTTVKSLRLKVQDKSLTFKAGQWVDTFLPGLEKVGGFSMCSSPGMLQREGTLDLAVKYSEHPPAKWIHQKCTVGTELQIRVGGDVYFDPDPDKSCPDLLLIAGGIGINPIHSIFCHVTDLLDSHWTHSPKHVSLLYSASSKDELIFHEDILRHCKQKPGILSYQSFVTKESSLVNGEIYGRRICREDLLKEVERMKSHDLMVFICGPPPMIHSLEEMLVSVGVQKEKVRYEKWW